MSTQEHLWGTGIAIAIALGAFVVGYESLSGAFVGLAFVEAAFVGVSAWTTRRRRAELGNR